MASVKLDFGFIPYKNDCIFVSCHWRDKGTLVRAEKICRALDAKCVRQWYEHGILPRDEGEIDNSKQVRIRKSKFVLMFISSALIYEAGEKNDVKAEYEIACSCGKTVVPVFIDKIDMSRASAGSAGFAQKLNDLQRIDVNGYKKSDDAADEIIRRLIDFGHISEEELKKETQRRTANNHSVEETEKDTASTSAKTFPAGNFVCSMLNDQAICITEYIGKEKDVIIPATIQGKKVVKIGSRAFFENKSIKSISIPESVVSINSFAFFKCYSLEDVIVSKNMTDICSPEGIYLPDTMKSINPLAFCRCKNLRSVTIPKGFKRIEGEAFLECSSLESITIPEGVERIGSSAFAGCKKLENIVLPESMICIEEDAFSICSALKSVTIPEGVIFIGSMAFYGCRSLESITIPASVTSIGRHSFFGCRDLTVYAPHPREYYNTDNLNKSRFKNSYFGELEWIVQ